MSRRQILRVLLAGLLLIGALFGRSAHPHFFWDYIPGFQAMLGLAGSWLLVVVTKSAATRRLLERPHDYYDA